MLVSRSWIFRAESLVNVSFNAGVKHSARESAELPEAMVVKIHETWETEYKIARVDLLDLFKRTCGSWTPKSCGADVAKNFDTALRRAYFNGRRMSHGVL